MTCSCGLWRCPATWVNKARGLWCRWPGYHQLYIDRGAAACLRCGRRWVGRSYD